MLKPMGLSMDAGTLRDSCLVSSARSRNGRLQSVVSYGSHFFLKFCGHGSGNIEA